MDFFKLQNGCVIRVPAKADKELIQQLLHGYAYGVDFILGTSDSECEASFGIPSYGQLTDGEYVIHTAHDGVGIKGKDFACTMRGFTTVLNRIIQSREDKQFQIPCGCIEDKPAVAFRSVHLCLFPETTFEEVIKYIRSCGVEKYSHIVLEFWGALQFDCLKELGWQEHSFTKDQVRTFVREANSLGMEVIPMFNHLGHAAAGRDRNGKHVVLDQNPALEYLFDFDGWVWDFKSEEVYQLLKKIREELMDLCGEGKYFHLGCDEAYTLHNNAENGAALCRYLNRIQEELAEEGRQGIIWGDMMLLKEDYNPYGDYSCTGEPNVRKVMLEQLSRNLIIGDWHYRVTTAPWMSSLAFRDAGFKVICCPWDNPENQKAAIHTAVDQGMFGVMQTTWHTMFQDAYCHALYMGEALWKGTTELYIGYSVHYPGKAIRMHAAKVARKVCFPNGNYVNAGWSEKMMGPGLI